jgi:hypothetical protein
MYSIEINFDGNIETAYEQLMMKLGAEITNLLARDKNKLQSILYRIDLSENVIKRALQYRTTSEFDITTNQMIAHEIIVRELKKVLTRNYFKNIG